MERLIRFRHEVVALIVDDSPRSVAGMGGGTIEGGDSMGPGDPRRGAAAAAAVRRGKRFASLVQLLEDGKGERLVRFAYATDGVARRGPVTLRLRDLERLRAALAKHPGLEEVLRL